MNVQFTSIEAAALKRVENDEKEFGVKSVYLPNSITCVNPKYFLLAQEPSLSRQSLETFSTWIDSGFTNFLYSSGDLILHYSAFKFLCANSFEYAISDIAKGALSTKVASDLRDKRWKAWLPVLTMEIADLGCPKIIPVGREVSNFLKKNKISCCEPVNHYSGNNNALHYRFYFNHPERHRADSLDADLREFSELLFDHLSYPAELGDEVIDRVFKTKLPDSARGLYLHYQERFSEFVDGTSC